MRLPRLFVASPLRPDASVVLDENAARHVTRVLRLRPGDALVLFDGNGGEYEAELQRVGRGAVVARVGQHRAASVESPLSIRLAQGVSRGERMDLTIQKAVELGVQEILPLWTSRSVVRLGGERLDKRVAHWQGVARSAAEQCLRTLVPPIAAPLEFAEWLAGDPGGLKLVLDPRSEATLAQLVPPEGPVWLLVGPEGGLSPEELQQARAVGFAGVRLGPRILRTETAALVAVAAMQTLWGDLTTSG